MSTSAVIDLPQLVSKKNILSSIEFHRVWKLVHFYQITSHTVWWCFSSQREDYFGNRFYERLENDFYLQRKCSPYFGPTEMSSLCDIEKLFLWQSIAQTSLFTCFCVIHISWSFCNHGERYLYSSRCRLVSVNIEGQ